MPRPDSERQPHGSSWTIAAQHDVAADENLAALDFRSLTLIR